eukprot:scaffold544_cov66-Phaeocystis_antarctica.AAC.5
MPGDHRLPGRGQDDPGQLRAQRGKLVSKLARWPVRKASHLGLWLCSALLYSTLPYLLHSTPLRYTALHSAPLLLTGPRQEDLYLPLPLTLTLTLTGPRQEDLRH